MERVREKERVWRETKRKKEEEKKKGLSGGREFLSLSLSTPPFFINHDPEPAPPPPSPFRKEIKKGQRENYEFLHVSEQLVRVRVQEQGPQRSHHDRASQQAVEPGGPHQAPGGGAAQPAPPDL